MCDASPVMTLAAPAPISWASWAVNVCPSVLTRAYPKTVIQLTYYEHIFCSPLGDGRLVASFGARGSAGLSPRHWLLPNQQCQNGGKGGST
jgi:hypothetical protein